MEQREERSEQSRPFVRLIPKPLNEGLEAA